jgi:hypothetical protein
MRDPWFGEQFGGLWTGESERVLPFTEAMHVTHEAPAWFEYCRRYVSVDYGFNDACVAHWYAVGPDGAVIIYREIYAQKLNPERFVDEITERTEAAHERIEWAVGDPAKPEVADIMRRRGLQLIVRNKNAMRDRAAGLLQMVDYLSVDPRIGGPRLRVASEAWGPGYGCPKTILEWKMLRRKHSRDEFAAGALSGADHAYDACRYFLQSMPRNTFVTQLGRELAEHRRWIRAARRKRSGLEAYPLVGGNPGGMAGIR